MSKIIYQASSLRAMARQMMPCAESKNISESNFCTLSLMRRGVRAGDGSIEEQHLLYGETHQPTFCMGLGMVLTTNEAEADDTLAVRLLTRDLERALASFGQRMVQMELTSDGMLELSTPMPQDEEAQTVRVVRVRGEVAQPLAMPLDLRNEDAQCLCGTPVAERDTAVLADKAWLLEGLRTAVDIASTRGNGLKMQGVQISLAPQSLHVEGTSLSVLAQSHYTQPWAQAPSSTHECMLSTDAVRHLLATLTTYGDNAQLTLVASRAQDSEQQMLTVQCDTVTLMMDC